MLVWFVPNNLVAQKELMYGQYIFNHSVINPAYAGGMGENHFGVLARNQWMGMDGAPKTETAYANLVLPEQLGLALGLYQDRLGPETNLHLYADVAYHARLSDLWQLSGGLRLMMSHVRVNLMDIPNVDPNDPYLRNDLSSGLMLNTGAGLLLYNQRSFFGLATPRVFGNNLEAFSSWIGNIDSDFNIRQHLSRQLFAYAGSSMPLSDEIDFIPSTLVRLSANAPMQLDINALFGFMNIFDFGLLLRSNLYKDNNWVDATGFVIGVRILQDWYLGYLYEYPLSTLSMVTRQTHEISLRFRLGSGFGRIGSPRYFL